MHVALQQRDVRAAIEDLKHRTLAGIPGAVTQLVYLASTRDYNTARYYHDGLSRQFAPEAAEAALAACHQEIFQKLVFCSVESLVEQLEGYIRSTREAPRMVLEAWSRLQPYRIAVPLDCEQLFADFFCSNIKIALAILQARQGLRSS
jgi:hypothetical protein